MVGNTGRDAAINLKIHKTGIVLFKVCTEVRVNQTIITFAWRQAC